MYKTIDLFAGIGGMRLGFEQTGLVETVFSCEKDKYASQTYEVNFGDNPLSDITEINEKEIPDFDILLGGFPCQAFSIAGKRGGFEDTRGTLFFDVARILKEKKPRAFLLENVKGLLSHKKGDTFKTIINTLENDLGYNVFYKVINSKDFNVPQKRERVYIVGFKENVNFNFPKEKDLKLKIKDILEKEKVHPKYYISENYLSSIKNHRERHESKGNGFGYQILDLEGISSTLVVGGMGRERTLIIDKRDIDCNIKRNTNNPINSEYIRYTTPREWARIQGFPDDFIIPVSDTQAYKQFGNSVSVPVINAIAKEIIKSLNDL